MDRYKKKLTEYEDTLNQKYSDFDYNAEADELFRLQRAQLERNQRDGVSDVLAQYAANTGMGGSSAAMSAAQQTASKYNSMIADALTAAEEKAYSRWAAERADLENKIASTKQDAYNEAAARFSLGDLSGYQGLGYDTSAYEAELERQRKAEKAAAAATARQTALAEAQARAQYGDLSGLKALGIDTSTYEAQLKAQAEASKKEVGINGMTKSQYDAQMERWLEIYKSSDDEDTKARAIEEMDDLYNGYFGYTTPDEIDNAGVLTGSQVEETLEHILQDETGAIREGVKTVDRDTYTSLVRYYQYNPYEEGGKKYVGESALAYLNIIPVSNKTSKTSIAKNTGSAQVSANAKATQDVRAQNGFTIETIKQETSPSALLWYIDYGSDTAKKVATETIIALLNSPNTTGGDRAVIKKGLARRGIDPENTESTDTNNSKIDVNKILSKPFGNW